MAGRKRKQDVPLSPMRTRVHPDTLIRYKQVADDAGIKPGELGRAAIEWAAMQPGGLEDLAETIKTGT